VKDEASNPVPASVPSGGSDHLDIEESVLAEIRRALGAIEFGSILIKIHGGRVVGLETSTKLRLDQ
jgi:hypothetical protein